MKNKQPKLQKETKETIELERNMLKITLEHMAKENEDLKRQLADMKVTARSNKELLKEYVDTITDKDKVVQKMNNTIEHLHARLYSLEEHFKNTPGSKTLRLGRDKTFATTTVPTKQSTYKLSDTEITSDYPGSPTPYNLTMRKALQPVITVKQSDTNVREVILT